MRVAPVWALDEEILMIRPQPAASMSGSTACAAMNMLFKLTVIMRSQASSVISRNGAKPVMPALLTRMVTGPSSACPGCTPAWFELDEEVLKGHRQHFVAADEKHQIHLWCDIEAAAKPFPGRVPDAGIRIQLIDGAEQNRIVRIPTGGIRAELDPFYFSCRKPGSQTENHMLHELVLRAPQPADA